MQNHLFIHIGLPKTGTTTLQNRLFKLHPQIQSIGRPYDNADDPVLYLLSYIRFIDGVAYDKQEILKLKNDTQKIYSYEQYRCTVISDETLSANVGADRTIIAQRLKDIFGDFKVLITIRNQYTVIISRYLQHVRRHLASGHGRFLSFSEYFEETILSDGVGKKKMQLGGWIQRSCLPMFLYYELAEQYSDLLGKENVCILPLELMAENPNAFNDTLCAFLGVDSTVCQSLFSGPRLNSRITKRELTFAKLCDRCHYLYYLRSPRLPSFIPKSFNGYLKKGKGVSISLTDYEKNAIRNYYQKSNLFLQESYNLDLKKYNYPLSNS